MWNETADAKGMNRAARVPCRYERVFLLEAGREKIHNSNTIAQPGGTAERDNDKKNNHAAK